MFTRRNFPWLLGTITIVAIAFVILTQSIEWNTHVNEKKQVSPAISEAERPKKRVDLVVSVSLDKDELAQFELFASKVSEDLPHIHVTIKNEIEVNQKQWEEHIQLNDTGDVHLIRNEWVLPLAIQGYYAPVDRFLSSEVLMEQLASVTDRLKWNSNLWAVPYELNPYLMMKKIELQSDLAANGDQSPISSEVEKPIEDEGLKEQSSIKEEQLQEQAEIIADDIATNVDVKVEEEILWNHMLSQYKREAPLVNFPSDDYLALWIFVQDVGVQQNTSIHGSRLTDAQKEILYWLIEEQANGWTNDELTSVLALQEEQLPLYLLVKWDNYVKYYTDLKNYYEMDTVRSPLPWLDGLSFTINAQSQHHEEAGKWIEKMNLYATYYAMDIQRVPLRASFFSLTSFMPYEKVLNQLYEKPTLAQQMSISKDWAQQLDSVMQIWQTEDSFTLKAERWINSSIQQ